MTTTAFPKHYRIRDYCDEDGVKLQLEEWTAISETPEGYWLGDRRYRSAQAWMSLKDMKKRGFVRWVSKSGSRRWCHPTIEGAMKSLLARKSRQISYVRLQLEQIERCLQQAEQLKSLTLDDFEYSQWSDLRTFCLGKVPAMDAFNWGG